MSFAALKSKIVNRLRYRAAYFWRRALFRTTFILVAGSVGKTTTKDLLAAVLASKFPVCHSLASRNAGPNIARALLRVRPWHRFAVI